MLDGAGISWHYYTAATPNGDGAFWSAYSAIKHIYQGPDWTKDVISPQTVFFTDVQNGNLPVVSWITPTCENSDHASCGGNTGPEWVASIVNAIGQSPYWDSTAIFVTWDDPGGWYDHVAPKMVDYDGLGFRYRFSSSRHMRNKDTFHTLTTSSPSILRFVEDRFGFEKVSLPAMRAPCRLRPTVSNFNQPPRQFQIIQARRRKDYLCTSAARSAPPRQRIRVQKSVWTRRLRRGLRFRHVRFALRPKGAVLSALALTMQPAPAHSANRYARSKDRIEKCGSRRGD